MRSAIDVRRGVARSNRHAELKGGVVKRKGTRNKVRTAMLIALAMSIPVLMGLGNCFGRLPSNGAS